MYSSEIGIIMEQMVDTHQLHSISEDSRDGPNFWMQVHLVSFFGSSSEGTNQAIKRRTGFSRSIACRHLILKESPKVSLSASGVSLKSIRVSPSASHYFIPRGEVPPWRLHDYR